MKFPQCPTKDVANSHSLRFFKSIVCSLSSKEWTFLAVLHLKKLIIFNLSKIETQRCSTFVVETYQCIYLTSWQHLTLQTLAHPKSRLSASLHKRKSRLSTATHLGLESGIPSFWSRLLVALDSGFSFLFLADDEGHDDNGESRRCKQNASTSWCRSPDRSLQHLYLRNCW